MKKMVFVKNTTEERRRRLREISIFGEISSTGFQQAVCQTYVFLGTKSFASSGGAFSCSRRQENERRRRESLPIDH
jgi:hypothetical protein